MTKSELITRLNAKFTHYASLDCQDSVSAILNSISQSLSDGSRVEIRGFGSFSLNYRPPRQGRNPKTGQRVDVPEKYVPHFRAGKELRARVNSSLDGSAALIDKNLA
jgi:integration host factor subunit beta